MNTGVAGIAPEKTFSFKTQEESAFVNVVVSLPGTMLGGQVKLAGMIGENWVNVSARPNAFAQGEIGNLGSASNRSLLFGGTALWSSGNLYSFASLIGNTGDTKIVDKTPKFVFSDPVRHYSTNTSGLISSTSTGYVFDLASMQNGLKLDLRGTLAYARHDTDAFADEVGASRGFTFSTWTGTLGATLFANIAMQNSAVLRPYAQAYYRQELAPRYFTWVV